MKGEMKVIWRGGEVGTMSNLQPDMWYLEGHWNPRDCPETAAFEARAQQLDPRLVMQDATKGTRVVLCDDGQPDDAGTDALVCSLRGGLLFVRRVFDPEAAGWLRENVE